MRQLKFVQSKKKKQNGGGSSIWCRPMRVTHAPTQVDVSAHIYLNLDGGWRHLGEKNCAWRRWRGRSRSLLLLLRRTFWAIHFLGGINITKEPVIYTPQSVNKTPYRSEIGQRINQWRGAQSVNQSINHKTYQKLFRIDKFQSVTLDGMESRVRSIAGMRRWRRRSRNFTSTLRRELLPPGSHHV